MSWFGVLALIQSVVNLATIGPIVLFVGLMVNEEALNFMPNRHYAAYIMGLFPSVFDWVTNVANRAPLSDFDLTFNTNSPGTVGWIGVLGWKRGALLVSMLWVAMLVQVIDRQWKLATIWAVISSLFAVFGIIHVPEAGLKNFSEPFWEQCTETGGCYEFAEQWMFFVAYLVLAGTFGIVWAVSKYDDNIHDPIDDESRHAFDDWFKEAKIVTTRRKTKVMTNEDVNAPAKEVKEENSDEPDKEEADA
jgi:AGZA family xanthine/uracil permease-like MFS transporter